MSDQVLSNPLFTIHRVGYKKIIQTKPTVQRGATSTSSQKRKNKCGEPLGGGKWNLGKRHGPAGTCPLAMCRTAARAGSCPLRLLQPRTEGPKVAAVVVIKRRVCPCLHCRGTGGQTPKTHPPATLLDYITCTLIITTTILTKVLPPSHSKSCTFKLLKSSISIHIRPDA